MKKLFALLSLFLVALLLVGCANPFNKTTNGGNDTVPTTTQGGNTSVTTLDPEAQKAENEVLKKALSQAVEQSLLNSNATKLSVEFSFEVDAEVSMKNVISEESKAQAAELEAEAEYEENAKLKVNFTFKAEIDTEALTVALATSFYISELDVNISDVDNETYEVLKGLFFDEEGNAKTFDLFIFYTYSTNVVYIGLNSPVKEGLITVISLIFKSDASASVDAILPNDDNYFVLDFNEYLQAEDNEENDPAIADLNEAKSNFEQALNVGAGFVRGQSVASAYRAIKSLLTQYEIMDEENTLNFDAIFSLISMAIADQNADDESEEYAQIAQDVKAFLENNVVISMSGDDYVATLPETNYLEATLDNEEHTPLKDLFELDTDSLSKVSALLKVNFNFTQTTFDGVSVEISADIEGGDTNNVKVEVEGEDDVELKYNMEASAKITIKAALNISSTLTLKLEELLPEEAELIDMLDNPSTVEEIDDFMLDNFGPEEESEPIVLEPAEE